MEFTIEEIKKVFYRNQKKYIDESYLDNAWKWFEDDLKLLHESKDTWKTDFEEYLVLVNKAKISILSNFDLVNKRILKYWPNLDVRKSLELSIDRFWGTNDGWKLKIKQSKKVKTLNMVETLVKNIDKSKVFLPYGEIQKPTTPQRHVTPEVEI